MIPIHWSLCRGLFYDGLRLRWVRNNNDPQGENDTIGPPVFRPVPSQYLGDYEPACGSLSRGDKAPMPRLDQRSVFQSGKTNLEAQGSSYGVCIYPSSQNLAEQNRQTIEILPVCSAMNFAIRDWQIDDEERFSCISESIKS